MENNCGNCKYFRPGKIINGPGACRRNPPVAMLIPQGANIAVQGMHSPVTGADWCGEHRLKLEALQ